MFVSFLVLVKLSVNEKSSSNALIYFNRYLHVHLKTYVCHLDPPGDRCSDVVRDTESS